MTELNVAALTDLRDRGMTLTAGHTTINPDATPTCGCPMDLIDWASVKESTDRPSNVHPTLARLVRRIADCADTTSDDRWRITLECGPLLVETAGWDAVRACLVVAWAGTTPGGLREALVRAVGANLTSAHLAGARLAVDCHHAPRRVDHDRRRADREGIMSDRKRDEWLKALFSREIIK